MNAAKQAFYMFATLLLLATSGWYFVRSSSPQFKLDADALMLTTDTIIDHVSMRQHDQTGKIAHSMESLQIKHIPKENTHWIKKPHLWVVQGDQSPWEINANEATALHGGEVITLHSQVRIHQNKSDHNEENTLTTEELTYYPKTKEASTEKDILFVQPGHRVQSKGMRANLEKKHVHLLGQAKGIYEPNRE